MTKHIISDPELWRSLSPGNIQLDTFTNNARSTVKLTYRPTGWTTVADHTSVIEARRMVFDNLERYLATSDDLG